MQAKRIAAVAGALAALAAWPARAQELQVDFITLSPVPIAGWAVAAVAGALAFVAHRFLGGRARTLSVMAAVGAAAAALGWHAIAPTWTHAFVPSTVVNLTSSPATVALQNFNQNYQLVNASSRPIQIVSIERVNAPGFTFIASLLPPCGKQQELRPGQFCYVALGPSPP
jgi:hypothetical protein